MAGDVIEVGLPIGPVTVSVNGLLRKLLGRKHRGPTEIVAERFLAVFGAHGVSATQIPRLLPEVGLDKLNSRDKLLAVLTNNVLEATARLFGIEREWLDGVSDRLYPSRMCYKRPRRLFEDLAFLKRDDAGFPVHALCCTKELNAADGRQQPVVLLLTEQIAELGDEEILRFRVYADFWDWSYAPARIQLKAMARLVYLNLKVPVPLYRVQARVLNRVRDGKVVPRSWLIGGPLVNLSLEDFALGPVESAQAKECEELPAVMQYIRAKKLEDAARTAVV